MVKANGTHLTVKGRKWFAWALQTWAKQSGVQLVLCVGWNAGSGCKKKLVTQLITDEYIKQKDMVIDLLKWHGSTYTSPGGHIDNMNHIG